MGRRRELDTAAIVRAYAAGMPVADIAERYGCARAYPCIAARRMGLEPRRIVRSAVMAAQDAVEPSPKWVDREHRRRSAARVGHPVGAAGKADEKKRAEMAQLQREIQRALAAVPKWVPKDLRGEYVDNARLYGEEAAASIARRHKRAAEAVR